MTIAVISPHQIDQVWPFVSDGLNDACMVCGGDITAGDLWQQCRAGSAFLIVVYEDDAVQGACVWRPERWATGPKFRCLCLYGTGLLTWVKPLREVVLQLMKDVGATALVTEGLEKWTPLFRRLCPNARRLRVLYEEEMT